MLAGQSSPNLKNMHFFSCWLSGPSLQALVRPQHGVAEFCDRIERRAWCFTMRLMSRTGNDCDVDGTIAFVLGDLDLAHGAILIVRALDDRDRHADEGEIFRDIPVAEFRIEPGAVPAVEGVVDVPVPARELCPEIGVLVGRLDFSD